MVTSSMSGRTSLCLGSVMRELHWNCSSRKIGTFFVEMKWLARALLG